MVLSEGAAIVPSPHNSLRDYFNNDPGDFLLGSLLLWVNNANKRKNGAVMGDLGQINLELLLFRRNKRIIQRE